MKAKVSMLENNAQQTRRDMRFSSVRPTADQASFTLCVPADYWPNAELGISPTSLEGRRLRYR
jgi:hypothetical protein